MTVKEIKEKKRKLEWDIQKLVDDFTHDTGVDITDINYMQMTIIEVGKEHIAGHVEVDIKL